MFNQRLQVFIVFLVLLARWSHAGEWWSENNPQTASLDPLFGANADSQWNKLSGQFEIAEDPELHQKVLTVDGSAELELEGRTAYTGDHEIRMMVRLPTHVVPGGYLRLYLAKKDSKDPGLAVVLTSSKTVEAINCVVTQNGKELNDIAALTENLNWNAQVSNGFYLTLRSYATMYPGWPEDFRALVERDMMALPDHNHKWLDVRVELRKGHARFWLDDHLVAEKRDAGIQSDGLVRFDLSPGGQMAEFRIAPLSAKPRGFLPVRLGGYANARSLMGDASVKPESLPAPNSVVKVDGVPFVFSGINAEGKDHLDVGTSLYREGNMEGYYPSTAQSWAGSALRDPARIQLRIPNGQYDVLYLIAASNEKKDSVPVVTAMFFRPTAGFAERFETGVPLATAQSAEAKPLGVTLTNGRKVNLWLVKIPLDPGKLSSFADLDIVEVELTKRVYQYRSYPDPFIYGWHQGGPPSAVHVYAATLGEAPVGFDFSPDKFGHVWSTPEIPAYTASVTNRTDQALTGKITVTTRSWDGTKETKQEKPVSLAKGLSSKINLSVPVELNGYHDIEAALEIGGKTWVEKRSFVRLAPDTRAPRWTEGKGALIGYWSYHGAHHTPKGPLIVNLMTAAGARCGLGLPKPVPDVVKQHWSRVPAGAWEVTPQPWAQEEPCDPKKVEEFKQSIIKAYTTAREAVPEEFRPDHVAFFPEPGISGRLTSGNYPEYWGETQELTPDEKERTRMFFNTAKFAAEAVRGKWPELKILIPWGDPLFIVPLLRAGFPKNLIDGSALDICHFERLPEQQLHQISVHRLYELKKEYEKAGIPNPRLQYNEGIFVPTEVGACSWREQMDIYHRWALISMAYGVKHFYSGWFAFDCASYYGSEHYGGCGIQRRVPYCDPKPAYAAYATMTDKLDQADFDGWLKTGSLTTYCLRFKGPKGNVYALWTLRGKRPVTLIFAADGNVNVTDSMNNTKILKSDGKKLTVSTDPSVIYVTGAPEIISVETGNPDHSDVEPAQGAVQVADLGDGSWKYTSKQDRVYENNNFDTARYLGKFSGSIESDPERGPVFASKLEKQEKVHELMPWYNTLTPKKPITLPGAGAALGVWVNGASDWGRVIYCLSDAKGERWTSIGTRDQWNCDDVHSWSAFNFDGWRYLRFELPGHLGYDNFRRYGTTWWHSEGGDGIVDPPLKLESLIIEQRSHVLYVNDVQPVASDTVRLGKIHLEYDSPGDASSEAVRLSQLRMPMPKEVADLPNPIKQMEKDGVGQSTTITKLQPPEHGADGTFVHVHFKEVEEAKLYFIWVSAHADGRGAVNMTPNGAKSGGLIYGLRPAIKLYYWVTWQDAKSQMSKPSSAHEEILVDTFKEK